jgi:hypothetical protein
MSNCPFCNLEEARTASVEKPASGILHRAWRGIQWAFPATVLVLMPKCPLCIAAYVALFAGVGISVSTARWIQIMMWAICLGAMAFLAIRFWRGRLRARGTVAA